MEKATTTFKNKEWNLHTSRQTKFGQIWFGVSADRKHWGEFVKGGKGNFICLFFRQTNMEDRQKDMPQGDPDHHLDIPLLYELC